MPLSELGPQMLCLQLLAPKPTRAPSSDRKLIELFSQEQSPKCVQPCSRCIGVPFARRERARPDQAAAEQKWAAYNRKMAELSAERDKYPVDSPEREAAAKAILALWIAEGS